MTTKILALTDALGNLVRFVLLPGQRFDTVGVPPLIEGLAFDALIACVLTSVAVAVPLPLRAVAGAGVDGASADVDNGCDGGSWPG